MEKIEEIMARLLQQAVKEYDQSSIVYKKEIDVLTKRKEELETELISIADRIESLQIGTRDVEDIKTELAQQIETVRTKK